MKYDRLIKPLKKMVDDGLGIKVALRAQDAASVSGETDEEDAIKLAKEMGGMNDAQRKRIQTARHEEPDKPIDEVIEDAKSGKTLEQIAVTLGPEANNGLRKYAREEKSTTDEAAATLIEDGLLARGFLDAE